MSRAPLTIRPAVAADAPRMTDIYNHGIAERQATFETRPREVAEVAEWLGNGLPVVVAERAGDVVGFARLSQYSDRCVYAGVGENGVYVDPGVRGEGIGRTLLDALAEAAVEAGLYKITSRILSTNAPSLAAHRAAGFREVGLQRRHGRLDGEWKDCVLVERLIGEAAE